MSTLAQLYLDTGIPDVRHASGKMRELVMRTHATLHSKLRTAPPTEQAERFVFSQSPKRIMQSLIKSGQVDYDTVMDITQPPVDPCWLEFPMPDTVQDGDWNRMGVFISNTVVTRDGKDEKDGTFMAFVMDTGDGEMPVLFGGLVTPRLPLRSGSPSSVWVDIAFWPSSDQHSLENVVPSFIQDAVDALFLLCVPRACEMRPHVPSAKLQKRRQRTGKLPLIEYKYVDLMIGKTTQRREPSSGAHDLTSASRDSPRLHRVIGHVRTYREGREVPKVTFVPEHWRGDATKGMIIHTHVVKESTT